MVTKYRIIMILVNIGSIPFPYIITMNMDEYGVYIYTRGSIIVIIYIYVLLLSLYNLYRNIYVLLLYYIYYVWDSGIIIREFKKWDQRNTITDNR